MNMDRAQALLEGGLVQRLHATPHLQPYTVAQHSWGMAMLLLALHPAPRTQLLWACLTHDIAERWVGDIPATAKWFVAPGIMGPLKSAEALINKRLGIEYHLPAEDYAWLKALDLAELYVYCSSETAMGNFLVKPIADKCLELLETNIWVPKQVKDWVGEHGFLSARTDDSFGFGD